MIGSFLDFSRWKDNKTNKQKMEDRIRNSVLNMIIDRDQSFLRTARKRNTNIIVNKRDGGIQEFFIDNQRYISIPDSFENKLSSMSEDEAERYMDDIIRLSTTENIGVNVSDYAENEMELLQENKSKTYTDITGNEIKLDECVYQYRAVKSDSKDEEEKNKEDAKEGESGNTSCKLTEKGIDDTSNSQEVEVELKGDYSKREYKFQDTELNPDGELTQEIADSMFFDESDDDEEELMTKHREEELKSIARRIVKSFDGRISKLKTSNPSKKIRCRTLALDNTENIYQNKKGEKGKYLKVNLILDMSGSMIGEPVKNAVEMVYIFNEIALAGKLEGSVIWSEHKNRAISRFPMPRNFIKKMKKTGDSEGLGKNLKHYEKELKEVDENICMTDGQLCDDPILKDLYAKKGIKITGVYVNAKAENLTDYTGSLNRWFTRSLVRRTMEELTEKLIKLGLRKKGC